MPEHSEASYMQGSLRAWSTMLAAECLRHLGDREQDQHGWRTERADIVIALRALCEQHGDNDWPDDLHLGDVIDKHLACYLEE